MKRVNEITLMLLREVGMPYSIPTQELIRAVLRDDHSIDIMIEPYSNPKSYVGWIMNDCFEETPEEELDFWDSYEYALESAIQEALVYLITGI